MGIANMVSGTLADQESVAGTAHMYKDLFLAKKIQIGMTTGPRVDDGGKVPGKIVGIAVVFQ